MAVSYRKLWKLLIDKDMKTYLSFLLYSYFFPEISDCKEKEIVEQLIYMKRSKDIDMNFNNFPNKEEVKNLIPDIYKNYRDSRPFTILRFIIWLFFPYFILQ